MDAQPVKEHSLSLHLSRSLDYCGLNEMTVQIMRNISFEVESIASVYSNISSTRDDLTYYCFGSLSEGTTTAGLLPDKDCLVCKDSYNVIQNLVDWQKGKTNLLMLHDATAPGYCRLQLLRSDVPQPREDLPCDQYVHDESNRVLFKQVFSLQLPSNYIRHGPAKMLIFSTWDLCIRIDFVSAYRSRSWPHQAFQWISRPRCGNWPTKRLLFQAVTDGIFLVPVGYKLSHTQDLEWRMSFSLTERRLMLSMNMTQIKCYVVLKMLMKSTPIGMTISSYHCKTAMFYCMEDSRSEYWKEENLVECIIKCLKLLLVWVTIEHCPHYILPEANLFAGKITPQNKPEVLHILMKFLKNTGKCLLDIPFDELGTTLQTKLMFDIPYSHTLKHLREVIGTMWPFCVKLSTYRLHCFLRSKDMSPMEVISSVQENLSSIIKQLDITDKYGKLAKESAIPFLRVWLLSLRISASIYMFDIKKGIHRGMVRLARSANVDIPTLLKFASICYCAGYLQKSEIILLDIVDHYLELGVHYKNLNKHNTHSVCTCQGGLNTCFCGLNGRCSKLPDFIKRFEDEYDAIFVDCVKFLPQEFFCTPPALRYEFLRSVGDDQLHRDPQHDRWMNLAAVDSLPLFYYLQYLTYGGIGNRSLQMKALQNLQECLFEDNCFGHLETGWNLLGQCMEQEGKMADALDFYWLSLALRPRNNAAKWHLGILWFKYNSIRGCGYKQLLEQ